MRRKAAGPFHLLGSGRLHLPIIVSERVELSSQTISSGSRFHRGGLPGLEKAPAFSTPTVWFQHSKA